MTDPAPLPSVRRIERGLDPQRYTGEAAFAHDRAAVFDHAWLCLGAAAEWPAPGDAAELEQGGRSLVVIRGDDGVLRAFFNICPHRAAPLIWPGERRSGLRALRCRYHGWRFDPEGALIGAPDFDGARTGLPAGLEGCRLRGLPLREDLGLVWAWLGAGAPGPLPTEQPALRDALGGLRLADWRPRRAASHRLACSWKVYVENYLEGYHIPYLHPGLARELHMEGYAVEAVGDQAVRHLAPTTPGALNEGLWLWIWPNLALNVYGAAASLERMVPIGPEATRIDYVYLADNTVTDTDLDALIAMSARTTAEDQRICEAVHHNLRSGGASAGYLSPRHEAGLGLFHGLLRAAWASQPPAPAEGAVGAP